MPPPGHRRPHAGRSPQGDREGLGAAQEGPAVQVAGGGRWCWPRSWRRRPGAATSASAWRPCSSTGCSQNMRLQSDPTILYGLTRRQDRVEPADPEERDRAEDLAQHLPDRRPAADADLQPGPRRDRGRAQSGRHQGAVFRRRRRRRPRLLRDAEGPQRQRAEMAHRWRRTSRARLRRPPPTRRPRQRRPRLRQRRAPSCAPCRRPRRHLPTKPRKPPPTEALSATACMPGPRFLVPHVRCDYSSAGARPAESERCAMQGAFVRDAGMPEALT